MTYSDRLFSWLWFPLVAPVLLFLFPSVSSLAVFALVTGIFLAQLLVKISYRCRDCGHHTRLVSMPNKRRYLSGRITCRHCGSVHRKSGSYIKKLS